MSRSFRNPRPANNIQPARDGLNILQRIRKAAPNVISCLLLLLGTAIILISFYWALFWGPEHRTQVDPPSYFRPSAFAASVGRQRSLKSYGESVVSEPVLIDL